MSLLVVEIEAAPIDTAPTAMATAEFQMTKAAMGNSAAKVMVERVAERVDRELKIVFKYRRLPVACAHTI